MGLFNHTCICESGDVQENSLEEDTPGDCYGISTVAKQHNHKIVDDKAQEKGSEGA